MMDYKEVLLEIKDEQGPLWPDKRADILRAVSNMHELLKIWNGADKVSRSDARSRLEREMEEDVDHILARSIELHDVRERGLIALMLWKRDSDVTLYGSVLKTLPGGVIFITSSDMTLEEQIEFRVSKLPSLLRVDFEWDRYDDFSRDSQNRADTVRRLNALAVSQDKETRVVTAYFDNEDDAVYAKCLV